MAWRGKITGALLGLLFTGGNPIGAFIGLLIGNLFDQKHFRFQRYHPGYSNSYNAIQQTFFKTTFLVMGHIAKADGRVSEQEIQAAQSIMAQMNLNPEQKQQAIDYFNQGKTANFNLNQCLDEFLRVCHGQRLLLKLFVEIQMQTTLADAFINQKGQHSKQYILQNICQRLGFSMNFNQQSYQQQHNQQRYTSSQTSRQSTLIDAYSLLEIKETASNHEIKRAYRKKMSQHHPDKLIAQGLPPNMIRLATDKAQKIQAAYEKIRQARGF